MSRARIRNEKHKHQTFIGTLVHGGTAAIKVVLNIMDGLKGVWHAGPFSPLKVPFLSRADDVRHRSGRDGPLLIDIIDDKRKRHGAISVWERSRNTTVRNSKNGRADPNVNRFIREPGHIEFASRSASAFMTRARSIFARRRL